MGRANQWSKTGGPSKCDIVGSHIIALKHLVVGGSEEEVMNTITLIIPVIPRQCGVTYIFKSDTRLSTGLQRKHRLVFGTKVSCTEGERVS